MRIFCTFMVYVMVTELQHKENTGVVSRIAGYHTCACLLTHIGVYGKQEAYYGGKAMLVGLLFTQWKTRKKSWSVSKMIPLHPLGLWPHVWGSASGRCGLRCIRLECIPYHYTPVHALEEGDPARRMDFCRFMINADMEDENFLSHILWTDESTFDRDGISNYHNAHYWAQKGDNPRQKKVKGHQRRFSVNVWMGIVDRDLIGPYFLPQNLNGIAYAEFLREELAVLLVDVPIASRMDMIYQHDGCPAHYSRQVREWLDSNYPDRWIGRGGPIPWPARCPDLTPCDYYLWGHMKELVYTTPINSEEELRERILNAADQIKTTLTSRISKTELRRRLRACIRQRGSQFEQHL